MSVLPQTIKRKTTFSTTAKQCLRTLTHNWPPNTLRSVTRFCWKIPYSISRAKNESVSDNFLLRFRATFNLSSVIGLTARCKNYTATKFEFNDFFPLKNIAGSQPPGYHARFTFYAQASRNAHVMLTTSLKPKFPEEAVYEFGELIDLFAPGVSGFISCVLLQLLADGWILVFSFGAKRRHRS